MTHLTTEQLEAELAELRQSPKDAGVLELIVRRPRAGQREILPSGELNSIEGLVGDNWRFRKDFRAKPDEGPDPDVQLTIMNSRAAALIAQEHDRWQLAGDQLYIDLDLSGENLPPGTQFSLGSAIVEVTAVPHTGCKKFVERFGVDAMKFVNSKVGRELNLRGINAKVIQAGTIRVGDVAKKIAS